MEASALIYLTLYLLSALICVSVAVYAWQRQTVNGALEYGLLAFNQALLVLFFILELLSRSKETKLFWDGFQWVNTAVAPISLLWFAVRYSGYKIRWPRLFWSVVLAFPLLFVLLSATNPLHHWVIAVSWVQVNWPFSELVYSFTPLDEIFFGYLYLIACLGIGILILRMRRLSYPGNFQTLILILAVLTPYAVGVMILLGIKIGPFRDYTPLASALGNLFAVVGLYRLQLFDIAPIARDLVIENLHDEVIVLDNRNRLVYLNPASARRLAGQQSDLIGQSIDKVYQDWPELLQHLKDPAAADAFSVQTPYGETQAYQLRTTVLRDRLGRLAGRLVLINDVTRLKAVEAELVQHRQYLSDLVDQRTAELKKALNELQANKEDLERRVADRTAELAAQNRELETFAYSVSHDLKAPLRGIDGYSRLLMDTYSDQIDTDGQNFLKNIRQATGQMYQLIEDLLEYSRFQRRTLSSQTVNLCQLTNSVLGEFANEIDRRGVELSTRIECQDLFVEVDGLTQALRNLVDNAIKFTRDTPEAKIEVGATETPEGYLLWVKDNGIGFDMRYQERIFEIFQRLHRSEEYPGTGIGLALVRKAAQRMGGKAWAESAPGYGSTFYIQLPFREIAAPMVQYQKN